MDIAAWLRELGLERYEQAFHDSDIGADVLADLTETDLEELGIALGHRKKLLEAIAALPAREGSEVLEATARDLAARPAAARVKFQAERRQLTVMLCDLVGSTELSARLDPEDMGGVIQAYHQTAKKVVSRLDGHVAKYMGDSVLVYFGYPRAHEDGAERAVRAGLELVEAVARLTADGAPLAARVGIATGLVMVGDLIGQGAAQEEAVVGETPNLAARLQTLAEPGTVVVAHRTRRLLGGLFNYVDLGEHDLKGFAEAVQAWRVVGESQVESRFEALHGSGLTPLVGRDEEVKLLLARWKRAVDGEGQVVLLSGEPGIGKSRIARALCDHLADEAHTRLWYFCSPFHINSALYPVLDQLARAAGFERGDSREAKLGKLEEMLGRSTAARVTEAAALFAPAMAIPTGERYPPLNLSLQRQKQRTLELLVERLGGLAASQPILMIVEDAHWIDPSTLELLDLIVERVRFLPALVIVAFRPEFTAPWAGQAHVTALAIHRLGRVQGIEMVERMSGGKALPQQVLDQIVARTDGVPLFVEELTKMVLESGLLADRGDRYELAGPLPELAIPATLHDSLMARLDRLAPVKEVAQIGAVIGRDFSRELLAAVAPLSSRELDVALDRLVRSELIFRHGLPSRPSYRFKHALVQEVAYHSLLKDRRQQLHAAVAQALEERLPGTQEEAPEVLAHHLTEAGLLESAITYWHEAGRRGAQRSANKEAIDHLERALGLLRRQPDSSERRVRELAVITTLGPVLLATKGFADRVVAQTYRRGRELCQEVGDAAQLVTVLRGLWAFHLVRAELEASREVAMQLMALAEREHSVAYKLEAHRPLGQSLFYLGAFAAARDHCVCAIALYDPDQHGGHVLRYGSDSRIVSTSYEAWALWFLGQPDRSLARGEEAVVMARRLGHPFTLAQTLADAMYLYPLRGEVGRTREAAEATIACADEYGFPYWWSIGTIHLGWALAMGDAGEAGLERTEAGLAAYRRTGATLALPWFLGMFAEAQQAAGRHEGAARTLDDALAMVERTGERFYAAELHRLRGALLAAQGARREAEGHLMRALSIADEQQAQGWSLRAATSLARLWLAQGRGADAHGLLAPVYSRFTEGFDTADLKNARALLEELA